jgi:hypothetical protein
VAPCFPNEAPCVVEEELEEELEEDEDATDVVPVLLLVCDAEEIVDEVLLVVVVSEGSRTSKLIQIKSIFSRFPKDDGQLT